MTFPSFKAFGVPFVAIFGLIHLVNATEFALPIPIANCIALGALCLSYLCFFINTLGKNYIYKVLGILSGILSLLFVLDNLNIGHFSNLYLPAFVWIVTLFGFLLTDLFFLLSGEHGKEKPKPLFGRPKDNT